MSRQIIAGMTQDPSRMVGLYPYAATGGKDGSGSRRGGSIAGRPGFASACRREREVQVHDAVALYAHRRWPQDGAGRGDRRAGRGRPRRGR
jgi:hypothetical protein